MRSFRYFLILIFFNLSLFANIKMTAPDYFIKGEAYYFEFQAVGSSVKFPKIEKIDGYLVEDLGTSRSLQIINGNYDEKLSKKYRIVPQNNFEIPSFTFIINDEKIYSPSKKIFVKKIEKTASNNFDLTLLVSKKSLYVGEDLIVKLIFKYKKGLQITNLGIEPPHFENFWYKKREGSNRIYEENDYKVHELEFLLFAQKSGELTINPLRVDVQMVDSSKSSNFSFFTASPKLVKVYSNDLTLDVKELPQGVNLIGSFDINANVDKAKIKQGESISYKLNIKGIGNFDDLGDISLNIPDALIYDNKPEIKTNYTNQGNEGEYSKVYSIIPNNSLIIPSVEFKYFDKNLNEVVIKKTKPYNIEVIGKEVKKVVLEKPKEKIEVKKEIIVKKESSLEDKITYFLLGIIFSILIFGLIRYVTLQKTKKQKDDIPLLKLVKKVKDKQELLKVLIPYLKTDSRLDKLIFECESDKDFKSLKDELLKLLKEIKI